MLYNIQEEVIIWNGDENKHDSWFMKWFQFQNRRKIKLAKSTSHDRTPSTPDSLGASKTNKNYLLERLLTGKTATAENSNEEEAEEQAETPEEHRDFDARSEALTFVIGMLGEIMREVGTFWTWYRFETKAGNDEIAFWEWE